MQDWRKKLGSAAFVTWINGGIASRLLDDAFNDRLQDWREKLGSAKFTTFVGVAGVAARWRVVPSAMIKFVAVEQWTQNMSVEVCRRVPLEQNVSIEETVWTGVFSSCTVVRPSASKKNETNSRTSAYKAKAITMKVSSAAKHASTFLRHLC